MKKIHLVYKTHLDIGFTDFASNVIDNYNQNYIPKAIDLAFEINKELEKPLFIWTTGSYLIWQYLNTQSCEKVSKLEKAIKLGYITWHALPVTFNTEAATKRTIEFAISMSKKLDKKFNKKTISSKMTDVPGHTIGLVDILAENGIKYFHVGMNGVSKIPSVPDNFLWKHNNSEVVVSYSKGYGDLVEVEGIEEKMCFMHTHDNSGPQNYEKVIEEVNKIKKMYPDYEVFASTMDAFAKVVWENRNLLKVVTEEIGDTWIHGIGSDPKNMSDYYKLMNLQEKWINNGQLCVNSSEYFDFNEQLMLVPEHTWGMDIKRYFSDYKNYSKDDFQDARKKDSIIDSDLTYAYGFVKGDVVPEMKYTNFTWETSRSYERFESSWKEQRLYIKRAIEKLPLILQDESKKELIEKFEANDGKKLKIEKSYTINGYDIKIDSTGALNKLVKNGIEYANEKHLIGELNYTIFGIDSYNYYRKNYTRRLDECSWSIDLFKPGMEISKEIIFTQHEQSFVTDIKQNGNKMSVFVEFSENMIENFGAPRVCIINYTFEENLKIDIKLSEKDAIRNPEGIWLKINPLVDNFGRYRLEKLKNLINPLDIVGGGNKIMHNLDDSIIYKGADRDFKIKTFNNRLVAIGTLDHLLFDNCVAKIEEGFNFNLLNTTWGTNYTMWYDEDIFASYEIIIN
ncbi:MAG: DUF5054 domain-containing protein [Mycoplasmatales bacterium]